MSKKKSSDKSLPKGRTVVANKKVIEVLKAKEATPAETKPTGDSKSTPADKGSDKSSNTE